MNRFLSGLIIGSVVLVPLASLIPMRGTILWYPQYLAFLLLGFWALSAYLWSFNPWLALLSGYSAFSYIFITHQHPRSLLCLISAYLGSYFIYFVSLAKNRKIIFQVLFWFGLFHFLLVLIQKCNLDPLFCKSGTIDSDIVGFTGSHNQLAAHFAALAPFFLYESPLCLPLSLLPIAWAHCSSAMIGCAAGCFSYFVWMGKIRTLLIPILLVLAAVWLWPKFDPISRGVWGERGLLWYMTGRQALSGRAIIAKVEGPAKFEFQEIQANRWLGFGLGSFFLISPNSQFDLIPRGNGHRYEHAHNDLIETLFDLGIIGFILTIGFCINLVASFVRCVPKSRELLIIFSSIMAQAIASLGIYMVHAPLSFFMGCLTTGLFYQELRYAQQSTRT